MTKELCYASAVDLARLIKAKQVSPVEVLEAHLQRIDSVNPTVNAIVTVVDQALEQAKISETQLMKGDQCGPLFGVPFTIKDCVDTEGVRTTRGSKLFDNFVPVKDATVVNRLKRAGGIFMGKTNMPEFALWAETDNSIFGRTVNPWNFERTPGGSSGGEAAALAAGLSPLGIGSDVGGSIRGPANFCGVVGLKATHGRVPLTGHWPETILRAMHVGPMARTVSDVALGMNIIAGHDGIDHYALSMPLPNFANLDDIPAGLRIGWNASDCFKPIEPEVADIVAKAASSLEKAGCFVEEVKLPALENRDVQTLSLIAYVTEASFYLDPIIHGREQELSSNMLRRLDIPMPTLDQYIDALSQWEGLRQDIATYFRQYDALICPTNPLPAHTHSAIELVIAGETVSARDANRATIPWNLTGSPAVSVPFGWSSDGLPIGVQIVGRHFDESTILKVATFLEEEGGTREMHPPL